MRQVFATLLTLLASQGLNAPRLVTCWRTTCSKSEYAPNILHTVTAYKHWFQSLDIPVGLLV